MAIDPKSLPDWMPKSQEFLCSDAFMCAPLGGLNEFSDDWTFVANMPIGPDGERLIAIWGEPQKKAFYKQQGVLPVPAAWMHKDFNSGYPVTPSSPTAQANVDGCIYGQGKHVMLFMTTASNYARIDRNRTEYVERALGGVSAFAPMESQMQNTFAGMANYGMPMSVTTSTDTTVVGGSAAPKKPGGIAMAGPRQ